MIKFRREQFFALIDQVQKHTRQESVAELEDAIAEAVAAAKQAELGVMISGTAESRIEGPCRSRRTR